MKYKAIDKKLYIENRKKFVALLQPKSIAIFNSNDAGARGGAIYNVGVALHSIAIIAMSFLLMLACAGTYIRFPATCTVNLLPDSRASAGRRSLAATCLVE
jgi:predicted outer membrane repeat protein